MTNHSREDLYKVCPECASEYRPEVERCADCGVPLAPPEELARRDARELPTTDRLVSLRTAPIAWVRALAADLEGEGIGYRIDRRKARSEGLLTLSVRRKDSAAAAAVDALRERAEAPLEPWQATRITEVVERLHEVEEELWRSPEPPVIRPRQELPPSDDLVCVCCRDLFSLAMLSEALDKGGLAHRIEPGPYRTEDRGACLYVLPESADAAAAIDAEEFGGALKYPQLLPELTVCPACGTQRSLSTWECAACGLGFSIPIDRTCGLCGAVVDEESGLGCPNCGTRLADIPERRKG